MKLYKKATALVLGAVLAVTVGGSSLQASDVIEADEFGVISQQEEATEEMNLVLEEESEEENVVFEEEILDESDPMESEEEWIMEPEEGTETAMSETEEQTETEAEKAGICSEDGNVIWKLAEDGNLVIEGNGTMTDWNSEEEVPWHSYREEIKSVEIREGVNNVGGYAFAGCEALTDIQMADSVHAIGSYAFYESSCPDELVIG